MAEWSDEIDVERANEARLRAEKRLASHDSDLDMAPCYLPVGMLLSAHPSNHQPPHMEQMQGDRKSVV